MKTATVFLLLAGILSGCFTKRTSSSAGIRPNEFVPAFGKIRAIKGSTEVYLNQRWTKAKVNQALPAGAILKTDSDSSADIYLVEAMVSIKPNSVVALENLEKATRQKRLARRILLHLEKGELSGNAHELADNSVYQIKTAKDEAFINNGRFAICSAGKVAIIEGSLLVVTPGGNHTIHDCESFDPDTETISLLSNYLPRSFPIKPPQGSPFSVPRSPFEVNLGILNESQPMPFSSWCSTGEYECPDIDLHCQ